MAYTAETIPEELIKDTLNSSEWNSHKSKIPKPKFVIWNEGGRVDLRRPAKIDVVEIKNDNEQQEFEGHSKEHKNMLVTIMLNIHTSQSRQRLHDIKAEIRRIINRKKFDYYAYGWHTVRYVDFTEDYEPTVRYWRGMIRLEMEGSGLILDTGE